MLSPYRTMTVTTYPLLGAGAYSWQSGSGIVGNLNLNSNSSIIVNWNLPTPNSIITLSGNLTASGIGTRPTSMTFIYGNSSLSYTTSPFWIELRDFTSESGDLLGSSWMGRWVCLADRECQRGRLLTESVVRRICLEELERSDS